jgi:hypothetical protein
MAEAWHCSGIRKRYRARRVSSNRGTDMKLIRLALFAAFAGVALQSIAQSAEIRRDGADRAPRDTADQPPRRLQISVRFDDSADASRQGIEASGRIGNRGGDMEIRAQDSRTTRGSQIEQRVQALEGRRAYISSGQSRPAMQRRIIQTPAGPVPQDTFVVQEAITGFEVVPRISGDRVFIEVTPQRQSFDRQGGVQEQQVTTSASGRLGEWFELAAIASSESRSSSRLSSSMRIWVKVEEIGN